MVKAILINSLWLRAERNKSKVGKKMMDKYIYLTFTLRGTRGYDFTCYTDKHSKACSGASKLRQVGGGAFLWGPVLGFGLN